MLIILVNIFSVFTLLLLCVLLCFCYHYGEQRFSLLDKCNDVPPVWSSGSTSVSLEPFIPMRRARFRQVLVDDNWQTCRMTHDTHEHISSSQACPGRPTGQPPWALRSIILRQSNAYRAAEIYRLWISDSGDMKMHHYTLLLSALLHVLVIHRVRS